MRAPFQISADLDLPPGIGFRFGVDPVPPDGRYVSPDLGRITLFSVVAASCTVETGGRKWLIPAGYSILVDTGEPYTQAALKDQAHIVNWCESDPRDVRGLGPLHGSLFRTTPAMDALYDLAFGAERKLGPMRAAMVNHLGHAMLLEAADAVSRGDATLGGETALRLRNLVAADIQRDWRTEDLAKALGLSVRTLSRRLGENGQSALELLWKERVRQSVALLMRSDLSSNDISELCGFKSVYHFSRRIKEETGMTPTALRAWAAKGSLGDRRDLLARL